LLASNISSEFTKTFFESGTKAADKAKLKAQVDFNALKKKHLAEQIEREYVKVVSPADLIRKNCN
jgi:hypothetical protein